MLCVWSLAPGSTVGAVALLLYAPWCRRSPRAEALLLAAAAECAGEDGAGTTIRFLKLVRLLDTVSQYSRVLYSTAEHCCFQTQQ